MQAGALLGATALTGLLVQWGASHLDAGRPGRHGALVAAGTILAVVGCLSAAAAPSLPALAAAVVFAFMGLNLTEFAYRASLIATVPAEERTRVLGQQTTMKGLGTLTAFVVGGSLASWDAGWPFAACAVALAVSWLITAPTLRSATLPAPAPQADARMDLPHTLLGAHFIWWIAMHTVFAFTVPFAGAELPPAWPIVSNGTVLLTSFAVVSIAAAWPLGRLAQHTSLRTCLVFGLVCLAAAGLTVLGSRTLIEALGFAVLGGIGFAAVQLSAFALMAESRPAAMQGAISARFGMLQSPAQLVGVPVAGLLVDAAGTYRAVYALSLVLLLLSLGLLASRKGGRHAVA